MAMAMDDAVSIANPRAVASDWSRRAAAAVAAVFVRAADSAGGRTVMRESIATARMAELEFEAPLAQIEDADDCLTNDYSQKTINGNDIHLNNINNLKSELAKIKTDSNKINDNDEPKPVKCKLGAGVQQGEGDNFTETFSGSLEDLVNTFDEKITKCFGNYEESVEKLAPVQVRSQEEIMNECQ